MSIKTFRLQGDPDHKYPVWHSGECRINKSSWTLFNAHTFVEWIEMIAWEGNLWLVPLCTKCYKPFGCFGTMTLSIWLWKAFLVQFPFTNLVSDKQPSLSKGDCCWTRWQHLSRLKASAFSLQIFLVVKKHSNLYLGMVLPSGGWQSLIVLQIVPSFCHLFSSLVIVIRDLYMFVVQAHKTQKSMKRPRVGISSLV